jgi:hypothetical protein
VPVGGDPQSLLQDGAVELAGRCIAAGVPIFLSYGSGSHCKRMLMNPLAEPVIRAGDRTGFVAIMRDIVGQLVEAAQADRASARTGE